MTIVAALMFIAIPTFAQAAPVTVCVPAKASADVKTPNTKGECPTEDTALPLPSAEEEAALQHITFKAEGVANKPTLYVKNVNVVVEAPASSTEGNVIVGPEALESLMGSNNIIAGQKQYVTGEFNILGGRLNKAYGKGDVFAGSSNEDENGEFSLFAGESNKLEHAEGSEPENGDDVLFGLGNVAFNVEAGDILGGAFNRVNCCSVSEGSARSGDVVVGGYRNIARGQTTVVGGGQENETQEYDTSVSGGKGSYAIGDSSWIGGGYKNHTKDAATFSSLFGGKELETKEKYEAIP
jgi:hypothetical protein